MSVRRWVYMAIGLFVLCGLGLTAAALPRGAAARNLQPQNVSPLHTYNLRGLFNFDVEVSRPLTTPTPFATYTPTPGTPTTPGPDLTGRINFVPSHSCANTFNLELVTYAAASGNAESSYMRVVNANGEHGQLWVPFLYAGQSYSNTCYGCVAPVYPITLTVDAFNMVVELNEGNNTYVVTTAPPIATNTPCPPSATRTITPTRTPTATPGTPTATGQPDLRGGISQTSSCVSGRHISLATLADPSGDAGPSTMRLQSSQGAQQDYPVPAISAGSFYTVACNPCFSYSYPLTLTVDVFDNVVETNENNNTYVELYPIPSGTPCPTRTATPTITPTSGTVTVIATPTGINQCYINVTQASTTCTQPDTYSYEFPLYNACNLHYRVNLYLDVAPDVGGPWVTVAERTISSMTGPVIEGSFVENVPPEHRYYQIRIQGYILATQRPFDGVKETEVTPICGRPLPCPLSWNARAPYPIQITDHAAASYADSLYSFGGSTGSVEVYNAYRYDPSADTWTSLALMPGVRRGASAVAGDGYVYVVNGWNGSSPTNTLFKYDPATNTYSTGPAGLMATSYQAAAFLNGKVYRIGGIPGTSGATDTVEIYGEQMVAPLPEPLSSAMAVAMDGYIYVAGGVAPSGVTTKTYRYDPASDSWDDAAIADLPVSRRGSASDILDGKWVLAGGTWVGGSSTVAWDPATNTWSSLTPMLYDRDSLTGGAVGQAFYTVGGVNNTGPTSDTQEYLPTGCASPTPETPTATGTATGTSTSTATFTSTPVQPTSCAISFTDVEEGDTFYPYVRCLACRQIIAGYADGTFKPNNNVTRGQLAKIVSNSAGLAGTPTQQTFEDVPIASTFHPYIERLAAQGVMGGYSCGGAGEPCIPPGDKPYFRPNANATRGQISKIVSNAKGYNDPPGSQVFEDVPPGSAFYDWIQRLASRGIMGGYACGGAGEPCRAGNRPYFRPNNNATRGQVSKIVANTFFPGCETPLRP